MCHALEITGSFLTQTAWCGDTLLKEAQLPYLKNFSLKSSPVELPGGLINLKITIWRIQPDLLPQKAPCSLSCKGSLMLHWGRNPKCYPSHRQCKGAAGLFLGFLVADWLKLLSLGLPSHSKACDRSLQLSKNTSLIWRKKKVRISATQKLFIFLN